MQNFRRTVWTSIIFIALLAPFAAGWLHWLQNSSAVAAQPEPATGAQRAGFSLPLAQTTTLAPPASTKPGDIKLVDAPIRLVSDSKTLWLVHPVFVDEKLSLELLQRSSNSSTWLGAMVSGNRYITGVPQLAGVIPPPPTSTTKANVFVVFGDANFSIYTLSDRDSIPALPERNRITAAVGAPNGLFTLSTGPRVALQPATDTAPAIRRPIDVLLHPMPATTTASTNATIDFYYNSFWYHDGKWQALPALAKLNFPDSPALAPLDNARVMLANHGRRLIALWINPDHPATLVARALEYSRPDAAWSTPVVSSLPPSLPLNARVTVLSLDQSLNLAWPEPSDSPAPTLQIRMVRLNTAPTTTTDLTISPQDTVLPLGEASKNIGLANGVALASAENSVAVVLASKNGDLTGLTLDRFGKVLSEPSPIEPSSPKHTVPFLQNIVLLVLVGLLAISLWQWRQRPMKPTVPSGMQIARLYQRMFGFLIDFAIPLAIVAFVFGINDLDGFKHMLTTWIDGFGNIDAFSRSPEVLFAIAGYLVHVTLCEMFFGKSLGKMFLGTQVLMVDGKPPTVVAVLVRNAIRIPEMLSGVLLFYMLISEHHQRLGDLIARTIVVAPKSALPTDDASEE